MILAMCTASPGFHWCACGGGCINTSGCVVCKLIRYIGEGWVRIVNVVDMCGVVELVEVV